MYGVTPPISTALPTEQEKKLNEALIAELKAQGTFESESENKKRIAILNRLQEMVEEFVRTVSLKKKMTESMAKDAGGKIFTFGSYRLGVYGPGSDIDTLVVAPKHVTRENFFEEFDAILRRQPDLEEISPVSEAYVPIIKTKIGGVPIDLIFAHLDIAQVPITLTLKDKNLLRNIDERDLRSLNGTRVTDEILELVPRPAVFKHALRAIKLWAQRRAVYANVVGFPGGVAWAMLVARVCQLYPNAVGAVILSRFFNIYTKWAWPQPVFLKPIEDGPLQVRVWNPKIYAGDRSHRMPVITPAYPSMCATHNITMSTQKIILDEMARAGKIVDEIMQNKRPWSDFFVKHDFFHKYKYYLTIRASTTGGAEQQSLWHGLVNSKLRHLVTKLELLDTIALAHPFIKSIDKVYYVKTDEDAKQVVAGNLSSVVRTENADLETSAKKEVKTEDTADGLDTKENPEEKLIAVYTSIFFIGLRLEDLGGSKQLDIQWPCQEFTEMCKLGPQYNAETDIVTIQCIKDYNLPDDVFDEGEERPTKNKSKNKKRKRSENGETGATTASKRSKRSRI
ncbi:hypothetical protein CANCADRAFT_56050 [Tortispora caseinolytica NRRL Y-17796]|uniref:Poly(A) polymerase n=1 Tax=Tortispora caseinolytica NRRL Y-17796 TaxID=767744 RepID=A0A1E4TKQ8_9ASCO|nr:hypothetical protein CANCADRAFT_56050 [Tortispora caseinolytica NRRL Y-17796]